MAQDPKYKDVQFISICCDKLDGARDIIEKEDDLRWQNINHYFMDQQDKELAKQILGFQQVPFYVVLDEQGSIQQSGNGKQVDFEEIPGIVRQNEVVSVTPTTPRTTSRTTSHINDDLDDLCMDMDFTLDFKNKMSIYDSNARGSSPIQVIDQLLFETNDF